MLRPPERSCGGAPAALLLTVLLCWGVLLAGTSCGSARWVQRGARTAPVSRGPSARGASDLILVAGGDVLLDRGVRAAAEASGDSSWSFRALPPLLAGVDIAVANLECPLSDSAALLYKQFMFRGDPAMARRMREAASIR